MRYSSFNVALSSARLDGDNLTVSGSITAPSLGTATVGDLTIDISGNFSGGTVHYSEQEWQWDQFKVAIANRMVRGSYVSCQSALAHYGFFPEYVPVVVSVTMARPARWKTPLGVYEFRHIKSNLLRGYRLIDLGGGQKAFVATPEKALLDLIHLQPGGDAPEYLRELRLQNLERLSIDEMQRQAGLVGSPKLRRAAAFVAELARQEAREYKTL